MSKVIYMCDAFGSAKYHMQKYKHWAKVLTGIDDTKTNGYAFIGDWLDIKSENLVEENSFVIELEDTYKYYLYKVKGNNIKELVLESNRGKMISFIAESKRILEERIN